MFKTSRGSLTRFHRAVAVGTSVSTLLAAMTLVSITGSQAATAHAASRCRISVTAAPWRIRGSGAGNKYTLAAEGMSCASARGWVVKFTHETGAGLGTMLKGPSGYSCESLSEAASGDEHVYAGVCRHQPHNIPFFGWAATK